MQLVPQVIYLVVVSGIETLKTSINYPESVLNDDLQVKQLKSLGPLAQVSQYLLQG